MGEIQQLKEKVANLEKTIQNFHTQQQQNQHAQFHRLTGNNNIGGANPMSAELQQNAQNHQMNSLGSLKSFGESFDPLPYGARGASVGTLSGLAHLMGNQASMGMKNGAMGMKNGVSNGGGMPGGPTLPPHPKQKQLPTQGLPGSMGLPTGRLDSLRGISAQLSRGISSLSRGLSTESQGGMNAFEDKFFSMLMNSGDKNQLVSNGINGFNPSPLPASSNMNGAINNATMNGNNGMDTSRSNKGSTAQGGDS